MSFSYDSRIGHPLEVLTYDDGPFPDPLFNQIVDKDYRGFYKKGETLGQFVFPDNAMITNSVDLFDQYHLYENAGGVLGLGSLFLEENASPLGDKIWVFECQKPVFVGDRRMTNPQDQVIWAKGQYNKQTTLWEMIIKLGKIENPREAKPDNQFYTQLVNMIDEIKANIDFLVATGSVTVPPTGGAATFANQLAFDQKMDALKQKLEEYK